MRPGTKIVSVNPRCCFFRSPDEPITGSPDLSLPPPVRLISIPKDLLSIIPSRSQIVGGQQGLGFRCRRFRAMTAISAIPPPPPVIPDWRAHERGASQIIPAGPRPRALFAWMGRDWRGFQPLGLVWRRFKSFLWRSFASFVAEGDLVFG